MQLWYGEFKGNMIIRKCSNCDRILGTKEEDKPGIEFSHALCKRCVIILYPNISQEILDKYNEEGEKNK
jgi:hypothetical protein